MHGKVSYLRKLKLPQVTNKTKKKKMNKGGLFNTRAQRSLESLLLLQASPSIFQRSKNVRRLKSGIQIFIRIAFGGKGGGRHSNTD